MDVSIRISEYNSEKSILHAHLFLTSAVLVLLTLVCRQRRTKQLRKILPKKLKGRVFGVVRPTPNQTFTKASKLYFKMGNIVNQCKFAHGKVWPNAFLKHRIRWHLFLTFTLHWIKYKELQKDNRWL